MRKDSKTTISDLEKENRHLKEQLKEKILFYENLLALMPGHVYWLDTNNVYLGCNNQQAEVLKLESRENIVGKRNKDLLWVDQASQYDEANLKVLNSRKRVKAKEIVPVNGELKTFLTEKIPLFNKSIKEPVGVLGISIDITELEHAQKKAEQASIAKSKFIANMSHDIRTPLTGIVGLSDILFDTVIKAEAKEYAKMLHLSGEQLLSLLNSVLEIVSSDSLNQDAIEVSSFELAELLHNIFELELPALKLKNLSLDLKIDNDIPAIIQADKGKLYRILLNLLSNSIKFTEEGGITIQVNYQDKTNKNLKLCFDIIDTGIGIPKTETDKIFNAFYRVHPSYEGKYQGFGVGLHLVKQYVDALGGEISVKSIEGVGTKFSLILPVEIPEDNGEQLTQRLTKQNLQHTIDEINTEDTPTDISPSPAEQKDIPKTEQTKTLAHILLVEDNPMAMKVADMILNKQGAITDKAYNSHDALSLFKKNHYDFVITDIGLPDYSGFELAQKMKAFEKEQNSPSPTPIIGLTAHAKQEALLQGNQCGMLDVCEKPLTAKVAQSYIQMFGKGKTPQSGTLNKPPGSSSQDIPLLDVDLGISQLGSIEDLKEMLDIMIKQSMVVTVNEIDGFFQDKDWESFKKQVHKFKSSCLYCATTKLLKLTQDLESLADTKDIHQIEPVYQQFCDCVISTHQYIESWLSMDH